MSFAIEGDTEHWFEEFVKKNGAHAIVHSKVIVLDPFGKKPTVMTGSHNMGTTASSKNDENLVIIEGDAALAAAYAVNIISIYNYRWRYRVAQSSKWKGIWDNDHWQHDYFTEGQAQRDRLLDKVTNVRPPDGAHTASAVVPTIRLSGAASGFHHAHSNELP